MKISLVVVGKLKENYLKEAFAEYKKRLRPYAAVEVKEIGEAKLSQNPTAADIAAALEDEGERLLRLVPKGAYLIALDLRGEMLSSENFAAKTAQIFADGRSGIVFAIGGAFGIGKNVTAAADFRLCLSQMTFTHQMARVILAEQIYRAFKINRGEKYHW